MKDTRDVHIIRSPFLTMMLLLAAGVVMPCPLVAQDEPEELLCEERTEAMPKSTPEQAKKALQEKLKLSECAYPGELDREQGGIIFYGFCFVQNGSSMYAWVNSHSGDIEVAAEIENYTGEGESAKTHEMSEEQILAYLNSVQPQLKAEGQEAKVTGERSLLSCGPCRHVRVGVQLYVVTPFGSVYAYEPEAGIWRALYTRPDGF